MSGRGDPRRGVRVAVMGLDNFSRKNRAQVTGLNARGYTFDVFTNDSLGDSRDNMPAGNRCILLEERPNRRAAQVASYLREHRAQINHVEVYPGGRFSFMYAALAKLFRLPVITVERGDLLYQERYDALTAQSMRLCYRLADVVWYREFYQEAALRALGARRLFFLGNAVPQVDGVSAEAPRAVDFAWVNRLISERKATWVADTLAEPDFAATRNVMYGFLDDARADEGTRANQEYVRRRRLPNLQLEAYADADPLLRGAKFFLLPSDIVYCNNALLEAMARGVVPLVSDVEGARLIVDHGVDGFVFPHTPTGLADAMRRAIALPEGERVRMSRAATAKVRERFSAERWCDQLAEQYAELGARGARASRRTAELREAHGG